MPRFTFKAKDLQGRDQKGLVEAATIRQASNLLHERGYFIIDLKEAAPNLIPEGITGGGIGFGDLVHFTRQLATMITAGLTLIESLSILQQQFKKAALVRLVSQIEEEVRGGKSFADVLEKHSRIFPPVYLALVRAGEASGKLDVILERLADNLEKSRNFRNKVRGALVYPSIVVSGMVIVSIIVMTVVVPRLTDLYKEFNVELPLPTQILIFISNLLIHYWWLFLLLVFASLAFFLKFRQTWFGKHALATLSISLPIFGPVIKMATLVEVTRTLSILIDGGVPILTSLEISQAATGNILFKEAFTLASKKVEKGFPLSEPLSQSSLFPPILGQMVAVGEQTGKLGESLLKLSKYFEAEADTAVRSLTTMMEPLMMVILGLGVGFLVMAVLLPIYTLTSQF